ncbi:MAG: hypothetical protein ABSE40_06745 [Candidatus Sulfotelmatobacter sp.]
MQTHRSESVLLRQQAAQVVKSLHASSQTAVARLGELNRLPADEWRVHRPPFGCPPSASKV